MMRYIVTVYDLFYKKTTEYSFVRKEDAIKKMAKLDKSVRYTYTYEVQTW